jgi:hypothetical protein
MRGGGWSKLLGVLAVCALTVAALAGGAEAKGKAHKKKVGPLVAASASAVANGDRGIGTATATCPRKTVAVGGGYSVTPPTIGSVVALGIPFESLKVGQKQWRVSVQQSTSGSGSILLSTFVYCRRGAARTSTAAASTPVPANNGPGATAQASCPAGRKAVSGGFSLPAPVGDDGVSIVADTLRAGVSGWQTRALSGQGSTVTSLAYCAKQKKAPKEVAAPASPTITTGATLTATATCLGKLRAGVGGFSTPGSGSPSGFVGFMYESISTGTGWRTSGLYFKAGSATPIGNLNSYGYCS